MMKKFELDNTILAEEKVHTDYINEKAKQLDKAYAEKQKWLRTVANQLTESFAEYVGKFVRVVLKRANWEIRENRKPEVEEGYLDGFEVTLRGRDCHIVPVMYKAKKDGTKSKVKVSWYSSVKSIDYIETIEQ